MAPNVEPDGADANVFGVNVLVVPKPVQVARDESLHNRQQILGEVAGHVLEAPGLLLLR